MNDKKHHKQHLKTNDTLDIVFLATYSKESISLTNEGFLKIENQKKKQQHKKNKKNYESVGHRKINSTGL